MVPDCVHPPVDPMQPAARNSLSNRAAGQTSIKELGNGDHTVLAGG
jgi:hypothetical protein